VHKAFTNQKHMSTNYVH